MPFMGMPPVILEIVKVEMMYYTAYDQRYRIAHEAGVLWMGTEPTPIVAEVLARVGKERGWETAPDVVQLDPTAGKGQGKRKKG